MNRVVVRYGVGAITWTTSLSVELGHVDYSTPMTDEQSAISEGT